MLQNDEAKCESRALYLTVFLIIKLRQRKVVGVFKRMVIGLEPVRPKGVPIILIPVII